jgi:hypothetical protein
MEIIRYSEAWRNEWEAFVATAINGTFLHSRAFFDHNQQNSVDDASFIYYKKRKIVAVLPAVCYEKGDKKYLHSHARATYGGFVVSEGVGIEEALLMLDLLFAQAQAMDVSEIIIRNPFRIFNAGLADETDYAMWYKGFVLASRELEIAVDLRPDLATIRSRYENGAKYNLKKALKSPNLQLRQSEDFASFWAMLEANLLAKHGTKPVHNLDDFLQLRQLVGAQNIRLFAAYIGEEMACGVLVFLFGKKAIHAQYIASDAQYQELRLLNAVIDDVIAWGQSEKYNYFNLGTANEAQGREINFGLFHFKEGFGGRGVLRETMKYEV